MKYIDLDTLPKLATVAKRHWKSCQWKEGKPIAIFLRDGAVCIKYQSGAWFHYADNEWW